MNSRLERLRKKPGGRNRRNRHQLGSTVKVWGGFAAAHHLGTKTKHDADVIAQRDWILAQKARELGVSVKDLDDKTPVEEDLIKAGMPGSRHDQARMGGTVREEVEINGLLGNSGLILSLVKTGVPGNRQWKDLEGGPWVSQMMRHKAERSCYVTGNRHHLKKRKKALEVMLARLPPWVALEISKNLLEEPSALREKVMELAQNFGDRYNVDVLGSVVHRESEHDLHIHLIFSRTREVAIRKKATARLIAARRKIECTRIRRILKRVGKPHPNAVVSELLERRIASGKVPPLDADEVIVENRRYEREADEPADGEEPPILHRRVLGHAYRSKLEIWRAAEAQDRDAIAAQKDSNPLEPWSFRGGLIAPELQGKSLEDIWWDLWTATEWRRVCLEGRTQETLDRVAAQGVAMAKDYLRFGSTVATTIERLAAEKKELQRRLDRLEGHGSGDTDRDAINEELIRIRGQFRDLEGRNVEIEAENETLKGRLRDREEHEGLLHEIVGDLRKKNKTLGQNLEKITGKFEASEKQARKLKTENEGLALANLNLTMASTGLELKIDDLEETLRTGRQVENSAVADQIEKLVSDNTVMADQIKKLDSILSKVSPEVQGNDTSIMVRMERVVGAFLANEKLTIKIGKIVADLKPLIPKNLPINILKIIDELLALFGQKRGGFEIK